MFAARPAGWRWRSTWAGAPAGPPHRVAGSWARHSSRSAPRPVADPIQGESRERAGPAAPRRPRGPDC
eukprot:4440033-Pyramimonas_sp.AAC.1